MVNFTPIVGLLALATSILAGNFEAQIPLRNSNISSPIMRPAPAIDSSTPQYLTINKNKQSDLSHNDNHYLIKTHTPPGPQYFNAVLSQHHDLQRTISLAQHYAAQANKLLEEEDTTKTQTLALVESLYDGTTEEVDEVLAKLDEERRMLVAVKREVYRKARDVRDVRRGL
ncbi:hypothetical protein BJ875DRAFT_455404 [Amylocarpus encephaloides]|uniref:Uncharacterized protein n=1 Tax=Amylocarpus encephaloides TaxID=45428 RepID=A0A9P8C979_9HELO|nr:hypothetical protein BJ875DRAFT_455404 [Amylocarpus encephaloides]